MRCPPLTSPQWFLTREDLEYTHCGSSTRHAAAQIEVIVRGQLADREVIRSGPAQSLALQESSIQTC